MTRNIALAGVALAALFSVPLRAATASVPASAEEAVTLDAAAPDAPGDDEVLVEGRRGAAFAGTKTDTPLIQVPQPLTVIPADVYLAQGAINITDTVRYAAGVNADSYGRDTRADSFTIRGVNALQFRDGMRDIFSYYASITSDPYNFSRVEVVRGPASVLFGQGAIGGIVNLVSKTPAFDNSGEIGVTYGNYGRREVLADLNGKANDALAVRVVARVRDADTYVDHVPDDRVMIAPSVTWRATPGTEVTLLGLYQEDDGGSTTNFLPIVGTLRDNPGNPRLPRYLFVGRPGYDRYAGRLLQGGGTITQKLGEDVKLSLKARYIDSNLEYFTHYTDSYSNPTAPYLEGSNGRRIGLSGDASIARLNVFSTDNNIQARFDTGAAIEHVLLAGVDYSWNAVRKRNGSDFREIDIYAIDYAATPEIAITAPFNRESQKQLGIYVQDQIRMWDRVSVVLGARRDRVRTDGAPATIDKATTFRAGVIADIGAGFSPFFSYTESFLPIAGRTSSGTRFRPQTGTQYETGVKWQPDAATLVTATAFRIRENNRPIADPANPLGQIQSGQLTTKGVEFEATRTLPGNYDLSISYGHNDLRPDTTAFDYAARHVASIWGTKTFEGTVGNLRLGAGVRYNSRQVSTNAVWTIVTPERTMVDALAELTRGNWRLAINATNLLDNRKYASCLTRGDCFASAPRNLMASAGYRF